jgi:site-specific DNA recombinase
MTNLPATEEIVRAAGYGRVSTRKQVDKGFSIGAQEEALPRFIERRGWELVGLYIELGVSGHRADRPEFQRLLRDADAGKLDVVVVPRIDRLGRSFSQMAQAKERLEACGVRIVAMDLDVDFATVPGLVIWGTITAIADGERRAIGSRVADTAEPRARSGKVWGGRRALYGYRRSKPVGLVVHPDEARVVRRIFEQAAAGLRVPEITYRLNDDGIRTLEGRAWDRQNVRRLLLKPEYRGAVTYKGNVVCEQGHHDPIVESELWHEAQKTMKARAALPARGSGRRPKGGHLLKGLLHCGVCGGTMRTRTYAGGRGTYFCDRRAQHRDGCLGHGPYPQEAIDEPVLAYFNRVGLDMEATRAAFADTARRRIAEARAVREAAERDRAQTTDALARMRRYFHSGEIDAADYRDHKAELTEALGGAEAAVAQARAAEDAAITGAELRDAEEAVLRFLADLRRRIVDDLRDAGGAEAVRGALVKLFEGFTLCDESAMARASAVPDLEHGWQQDLFFRTGEGATCYLLPRVRPVVVDGFDVPAELLDYAPASAFPVLRRTVLVPPPQFASILDRTG